MKELHGRGRWKLISAFIGTRDALQVKNHARQYYRKLERDQAHEESNGTEGNGKTKTTTSAKKNQTPSLQHLLPTTKSKKRAPVKPRKGAGKTVPTPKMMAKTASMEYYGKLAPHIR